MYAGYSGLLFCVVLGLVAAHPVEIPAQRRVAPVRGDIGDGIPNRQYLGGCSAVGDSGQQKSPAQLGLFDVAAGGLLALYLLRPRRNTRPRPRLKYLVLGLFSLGPVEARADLSANIQTFQPAIGPDRQANRRAEFLLVNPATGQYERAPCICYTPAPRARLRQPASRSKSTTGNLPAK